MENIIVLSTKIAEVNTFQRNCYWFQTDFGNKSKLCPKVMYNHCFVNWNQDFIKLLARQEVDQFFNLQFFFFKFSTQDKEGKNIIII